MPFVNAGNFDAGVITRAGAPSGAMTLDAAGIASGGAFLISELEKKDTLIREPLDSFTYPRDIVIEVGGGWVDFISAQGVSYGVTGGSGESPIQAGGSNGLPVVQASVDKGTFKAHTFGAALRVKWVDMQKSNFVGRSLEQLLTDGMRRTYDKHMDQNVYVGFTNFGTTGLINDANVTATTAAATGTGSSTEWADKTPEQILQDVNDALTAAWAAAEYDESAIPNHVIIPYSCFTRVATTKVTELAEKTILKYILENNILTLTKGKELFIGGCKWLDGAGAGSTNRMVVYNNDKRFVKMDELVPLTRAMTQPNATSFCYDTAYAANLSEVQIFYPQTFLYVDGI